MDDVTRVEWRAWGDAAFEEAASTDRPILLSLTATWCDHCAEMDERTYTEPRLAANLNDRFVPVRVDADRRPRVRDRYNMGGFPSTVFLTPGGEVLTGAGFLGPDGMRQVIESVATMWAKKGADAGRTPRVLRDDGPPAGSLSSEIEATTLGQLRDHYDDAAGGWGSEPKFPLPGALEFALKRDREMALRCFDAVGANLLDEYDGGFHRFATEHDWSGVQREKLLDSNAALVRAFSNAYLYTGRDEYRIPAERTIAYLTTTLWNEEIDAFANSQAPGDDAAYTPEPSDREADQPPVDEAAFAGSNALAIDALLTYAAYTDDERASRYAERALETLRERIEDGVVAYRLDEGSSGAQPAVPGANMSVPHLQTQARTLQALLSAVSVLGADTEDEVVSVAETTIERLRDDGSFLDAPPTGAGLLERPLRPLDANVELANALVDLAIVTGRERYRALARETLEAFAGASDRLGPQVAAYSSIAARLLEPPLVVRVGTGAGSDLHRGALRLSDHEKIVIPNADGVESDVARIERGSRVSEPAETPAELSERVRTVLEVESG